MQIEAVVETVKKRHVPASLVVGPSVFIGYGRELDDTSGNVPGSESGYASGFYHANQILAEKGEKGRMVLPPSLISTMEPELPDLNYKLTEQEYWHGVRAVFALAAALEKEGYNTEFTGTQTLYAPDSQYGSCLDAHWIHSPSNRNLCAFLTDLNRYNQITITKI
jgi:hypothetical protein